MAALIASAFLLTALLWFTRAPSKSRGSLTPLTPLQRMHDWRDRVDSAIGLDSEERDRLHAIGSKAKRRLLQEARNRAAKPTSLQRDYVKPIQVASRFGDAAKAPVLSFIHAKPLKSIAAVFVPPAEQIPVVRRKLRLAR